MKIRFGRQARSDPDSIGGMAVPYAAAKRVAAKWRWYLILAVIVTPALALAIGMLGGFLTRSANGTIALDQMELRSLAEGRIEAVAAQPGTQVPAGHLLVSTRALTGANVGSTSVRSTPARSRSISASERAELELMSRAQRLATQRRDAVAALVNAGAATRAELREAEYALDRASADTLRAYREFHGNPAPAEVAVVATTNTHNDDSGTNRAPFDARVLDVFVTPGEIVRAGDPLLLLGRNSDPRIVAYVPPDFATRIPPGSVATILFADGSQASAHVTEPARVTRRMPADMVDNFGLRPMMVILELGTADRWPAAQSIHGMPVRVRFHYGWEQYRVASVVSPVLNWLTGSP
jgi:multidrug resistance efflux pump